MKQQVLCIHGGTTFKTREDYLKYLRSKTIDLEKHVRWSETMENNLKDKFEFIFPKMPLKEDAKYEDWKIIFEKYLEVANKKLILIGNSLGGIFLAKYLSENRIQKEIISLYLVAAPFDDTLDAEDLAGGFELNEDISLIEKTCQKVNLLYSKDDNIVPISHGEKYLKKLSKSKFKTFSDKNGHFLVSDFPEIEKMLLEDIN